jgi:hygromycin-B 4-O-kinase
MHKTVVNFDSVCNFVKDKYGIEKENISYINSGEFSSSFLLAPGDKKMVFRVNLDTDLGFRKDNLIHTAYPNFPTPKIIENGRFESSGFYSLSEMVAGKQLNKLSTEDNISSLPSLFLAMNEIHTAEFSNSTLLNNDDWKSILRKYTVNGYDKIEGTFFDDKRYKQLLAVFSVQVEMTLPHSYLLHGDFGRTNIFAENGKITGIIDWSEAMRGDFLWDLAWIAFWPTEIDFVGEYYKFNEGNGRLDLSNFEERISLYTLAIGIHTLLFAGGMRNDEKTYGEAVERTERFLS